MSRGESEKLPYCWHCNGALRAAGELSDWTVRSRINLRIQLVKRYRELLRHRRGPLPRDVTLFEPVLDDLACAIAPRVG